MKHIVFVLFLLIPAFAFSQFGLNAPNRGLTELGKQTSARGLTYLGSGMPNTVIKWRVAKDTACYTWIDTLTSLEYKWNHTGDYWATQGIISKTTPPLATQTSGPATVDNREALWRSTANNVIHGYDRNQSAWVPVHVLRLSAAPSNISSSGSQGAAIYTGGLWKSTVDDSMRHYIAGAWRVISGGGSTYTAGTGIAISGSNVISNTGDLSTTNELNTGFDISGGNLRITDAGGARTVAITAIAPDQSVTNEIQAIDTFRVNGANLELSLSQDGQPVKTLAVSSIAPVQAVSAGTGISISGTTTRTITNTAPDQTVTLTGAGINSVTGTYPNFTVTGTEVDGSTTNELQNLSLSGQSLGITSGTGVTLPIVDVVAGTGITVSKAAGAATVNSSGITALTGDVTASGPGSAAATIAANAVTSAKLAAGAVSDSSKIAANAVRTTDIADGQVWANDIANGAVTMAKINQAGATSGQVIAWNGSAWAPAAASSGAWATAGNSATAGSSFLGTTNNTSLRFRTNNVQRMMIDSLGNLGIGVNSNSGKLHVKGLGASSTTTSIYCENSNGDRLLSIRDNASIDFGATGFFGGIGSITFNSIFQNPILFKANNSTTNSTPMSFVNSAGTILFDFTITENRTSFRVGDSNTNLATGIYFARTSNRPARVAVTSNTADITEDRTFTTRSAWDGATAICAKANSSTQSNPLYSAIDENDVQKFAVAYSGKATFFSTNTASGTTGAQTINRPCGTVNFAAGASSLVVTNSLVTTASIVFAVVRTNDATAVIKNVVPGAGSFTINLNAAATAETSVGFFVIN